MPPADSTVPHAVRHDLSVGTRAAMVELLNARLADAVDLQSQAKQAHWNVKGPHFLPLHELFDKVAGAASEAVDEIAERAVALGGTAAGTARLAAARSTLPEYPATLTDGPSHVAAVADRLAAFGRQLRAAIETSARAGDAVTSDLFTGICGEIDKLLWFVEAHGQAAK